MIAVLSRHRGFARNQTGKRKVVAMVRPRAGHCAPQFLTRKAKLLDSSALGLRRARSPRRRDNFHEPFEVKKSNHQEAHSLDGAYVDMAEDDVSRLRRAEIDIAPDVVG
jgi:hypothetical protein